MSVFTELWWICNGYGISREQTTSAASEREGVFDYLGKTNACIVDYEGIFGKSVNSLKSTKRVHVCVCLNDIWYFLTRVKGFFNMYRCILRGCFPFH